MSTTPTVLLTGAAGYIASHTWLALLQAGYEVVGIDDFSNSSPVVLERLHELSHRAPVFERADVRDAAAVDAVFQRHSIDAAVHFAAFKAVGESTSKPLDYYANNIGGLLTVCQAMQRHGSKRFVFSLQRHRLRPAGAAADPRGCGAAGHQPLRPDQARG